MSTNAEKSKRLINYDLNNCPCRMNKNTSFGFGDRIGIGTRIHAELAKKYDIFPIFAQQSAREISSIGRTCQDVLKNASVGVDQSEYKGKWGADADHIRDKEWLLKFLDNDFMPYSMFTIDTFDYINTTITEADDNYFKDRLCKAKKYIGKCFTFAKYKFTYSEESIYEIVSRYYRAIDFLIDCYRTIKERIPEFDFEPAFDEKGIDTTPEEHYYLVSELIGDGVNFTSFAPKFPGIFEKGIDYIGDVDNFIDKLKIHKEISDYFSSYKLSLHSADDKLKVIGPFAKILQGRFHIKTSGSTWMEALRTLSQCNTDLFKEILRLALENAEKNSTAYYLNLDFKKITDLLKNKNLEELVDIDQTRQLLHISYGLVLKKYMGDIKKCLFANEEKFASNVTNNYKRYFEAIYSK